MPLLLSVLFLVFSASGVHAQNDSQPVHRIALSFSDDAFTPDRNQLAMTEDMGITLFEVSDPAMLQSLQAPGYRFLLDAGPEFSVPGLLSTQFEEEASRIAQTIRSFQQTDGNDDRIAAISVLKYPFETHPRFPRVSASLSDTLQSLFPYPLYYHSAYTVLDQAPAGYGFQSHRADHRQPVTASGSVLHFVPSEDHYQSISYLNDIMNYQLSYSESLLVIPAGWFYEQINENQELRFIFQDFIAGNQVTFPMPKKTADAPFVNWSVILLMLIWGSFALHYRYQPIYSQSMTRYFTNHPFFVNDVLENRMRNVLPGFILLIQHALLTGLFVFACVEVVVSNLGLGILNHHFQAIMMMDNTLLSLFLTGILIALLLKVLSVLWIFLANKKLTSFSQILNLYSWPMHLNLLVVTFLIVFNRVGFGETWILVLGAFFVLIWFFSFNIAAIDSSKFLDDGRLLFLSGTVGIHVLLVIGILIYLLYTPAIIEPILFAIELP